MKDQQLTQYLPLIGALAGIFIAWGVISTKVNAIIENQEDYEKKTDSRLETMNTSQVIILKELVHLSTVIDERIPKKK